MFKSRFIVGLRIAAIWCCLLRFSFSPPGHSVFLFAGAERPSVVLGLPRPHESLVRSHCYQRLLRHCGIIVENDHQCQGNNNFITSTLPLRLYVQRPKVRCTKGLLSLQGKRTSVWNPAKFDCLSERLIIRSTVCLSGI